MDNLQEKVFEIIADELKINIDNIALNSSFIDDLGADSLAIVSLIMRMEDEFNIEVPEEDAEKIQKVEDVINYIKANI